MSERPFFITVETGHPLIAAELSGFWSQGVLDEFASELERIVPAIRARFGAHRMLVDLTPFHIQSQAMMSACRSLIVDAQNPPERLALVMGRSILARMQFRRAADASNVSIFEDAATARHWLLDHADSA